MTAKNSELGIVHHAWALSDSYLHLDLLHVTSIRGRPGETKIQLAIRILILLTQLLSVRQTDDVVVHLPPSSMSNTSNSSTTMPIYMVIALHGMGPNYPDLFQNEVEKVFNIPFFSADPKRSPGTPWRIALESLLWSTL